MKGESQIESKKTDSTCLIVDPWGVGLWDETFDAQAKAAGKIGVPGEDGNERKPRRKEGSQAVLYSK